MTEILAQIDKLFLMIPESSRSAVAIFLLFIIIWSIFRIVKGYAIYLIPVIILIPGVWPALKVIGADLLKIFGYIIYRI